MEGLFESAKLRGSLASASTQWGKRCVVRFILFARGIDFYAPGICRDDTPDVACHILLHRYRMHVKLAEAIVHGVVCDLYVRFYCIILLFLQLELELVFRVNP